jgi:hypothetical protein
MKCEFAALIVWTMLELAAGENGYELSIYQEAPGVHFEDLGYVTLSTTTWTILVYVPVQMTGSEIISLELINAYYMQTTSSSGPRYTHERLKEGQNEH